MSEAIELMPRKPRSFRIDERVFDVIKTLAERSGVEPQQFLENYFFARGKELGLISPCEKPLGETRGGKREKAGRKPAKNQDEESIDPSAKSSEDN